MDEPLWFKGEPVVARRHVPPRPQQHARLLRVETLESKQLLAADVYVNDNWVELVNVAGGTAGKLDNGDVVDNSADAGEAPVIQVFDITAFSSIQDGIDIVDPAGTVHVLLGSYTENIVVDQSLHLSGAGESKVTVRPALSAPGVGEVGSLPAGSSSIVLVQADNVEISDITFDGDNTAITSGAVVGGADIDVRNGIITNFNAVTTVLGLNVHDVTVQNVYLRGIQAATDNGTSTFADNVVINVQGDSESVGIGIIFGGSGTISGNVVDGRHNRHLDELLPGHHHYRQHSSQFGGGHRQQQQRRYRSKFRRCHRRTGRRRREPDRGWRRGQCPASWFTFPISMWSFKAIR